MEPGRRMEKVLGDMLDLPKDLVLELPRIVVIGQKELYVQNHKGIMDYSGDQIRINLARGYLEVLGSRMEIKSIMPDEITIWGRISEVRFVD